MKFIANVFPKCRTPKNAVREMSKKCLFTIPLNKQRGNHAGKLFKSERREFYRILSIV